MRASDGLLGSSSGDACHVQDHCTALFTPRVALP
eukprot:CAMPEP_0173391174 /NCGR_PEP_ID=MMETSP1356-20130122/17622_1 /TAXON_ID=77927 ORGANISM="Hemiselmis virescens, Strain PCC157" /NCGR_SAMPLE_ID=MMETSP1356 /ASSEMBLY_ACC=CAM_ASM_000847 /LENGTH=33 /DNA_ID= /DNA_START= /DNA_END= /DNA_ORIENTATION=